MARIRIQSNSSRRLLLQCLLVLLCVSQRARAQSCGLSFRVYSSADSCRRNEPPIETESLISDGQCNSMESSNSAMPGTYRATCVGPNTVRISESGCLQDDCSSANGRPTCDRDVASLSSFYSLLNPPEFLVQDVALLSASFRCFTIRSQDGTRQTTFTIFGSCQDCALEQTGSFFPTDPPTPGPSLPPTNGPSAGPTPQPSLRPTGGPTNPVVGDTQQPVAATGTPIAAPTGNPTVKPTAQPSDGPTEDVIVVPVTPSLSPAPGVFPGNGGGGATQGPTAEGAREADVLFQKVMYLNFTSEILTGRTAIFWEGSTSEHIAAAMPDGLQALVRADIRRQDRQDVGRRRNLQQAKAMTRNLQGSQELRIEFDTSIIYRPLQDGETEQAIESRMEQAFNSEEGEKEYIERLKATGNAVFDQLESVRLETRVDGIGSAAEAGPRSGSRNRVPLIAGVASGLALLLALLLGLFLLRRNRQEEKPRPDDSDDDKNYKSDNTRRTTTGTTPTETLVTEINVDEQDDISTLGGSVLIGVGLVGEDERTASIDGGYDYARTQQQQQLLHQHPQPPPSDEPSSDRDQSMFSTSLTSLGPLGHGTIDDEGSFDQVFLDGEDGAPLVDRYEVKVPPGKLGMVVDTPSGGAPIVHAIKDDSVLLNYQVQVGDQLVHVDHEDVTRLSAVEVSTLIHAKNQEHRTLGFARPNHAALRR